ncbi:hypothetical protein TrLO_g13196 [Triparma laevis f. longispina]|uniref:Glycoside hydrolase family 5 protein n=1 Tax=Triparma laevis f. longispina TaxID=1714387 RepID=A0A9W7CLW7_9STRA|nr:hypothetical protein TrLO_g13196 [Triparma laevis f. longispina]
MTMISPLLLPLLLLVPSPARSQTYCEAWLYQKLSHPTTTSGYLSPTVGSDLRTTPNTDDMIRTLTSINATYAGRSIFLWGQEQILPTMLPHIVTKSGLSTLNIPNYVFTAFDVPPPTSRKFDYDDMLSPSGQFKNHWGTDASVPDLRRLESRLWFYFLATQYIDQGIEAIHCGQIHLMSSRDYGMVQTNDLFTKIRAYAETHARRKFVLLSAHLYEDPYVHLQKTNKLIFDFHAFPSRPKPDANNPQTTTLSSSFSDPIYGKSAGGIFSGFTTSSLPYIVELDNYDCTNHPGNDPVGRFQMPIARCLCNNMANGQNYYYASDQTSDGFGDEEVIKAIWANWTAPIIVDGGGWSRG